MAASSLNQSANYKTLKWVFFGLSVALSLFLIINGAIPGEASTQESNVFVDMFAAFINAFKSNTINPSNYQGLAYVIRKLLGHFLAFLIDGVFISLTCFYFTVTQKWYKFYYPIIMSFGSGLIIASISELLQVFTTDRVGSFIDILIDMGGFIIGMLIVYTILYFTKRLIIGDSKH